MRFRLITTYKHHFWIGLIISIWLIFFLVIVAPFDVQELPFAIRLELMPLYGIIAFIGYIALIPIQNWLYLKTHKWTLVHEFIFLIIFNVVVSISSYFYYKSDIVNGDYAMSQFFIHVYIPTLILLLIPLVILRLYLFQSKRFVHEEKITLRGDNKHDILQIPFSDLVCASSADNYVVINYIEEGKLQKRLLRNTLKGIQDQQSSLLKVHRSHLINPLHFVGWKNSATLILTHVEVPVSKAYKNNVLSEINHP